MGRNFLNSEETKNKFIESISGTKIKPMEKINKIFFNINFIDGAFLEITGNVDLSFDVSFYDNDKNELIHSSTIGSNMWTKTNRKYFTNWRIEIKDAGGNLINSYILDFTGKKVYIAIDSSSLGDNIAWMPFLEEFRRKHNCNLTVSTFWNDLFQMEYPEIDFVNPGHVVEDLYAMYIIGCFYNENLEPELCSTIPLQKVATNILGLEHKEIRPLIHTKNTFPFSVTEKYVAIAPHSTAGLKHWNNPTGWQEVVDFLNNKGYKVYNVSREGCELNGVNNLSEYSIDTIINCIKNSEFFIGLSSGLSWLAWALNKRVVLISNFTNEEHEFSDNCIRIVNKSVCNSCWINPNFRFDKGDWNWCPIHKGTERQFECSKLITGQMVIDQMKGIMDY